MKSFACGITLCLIACLITGCSGGKLSRREATHQINAMLKPHPVGPKKVMAAGVPGFELASDDHAGNVFFTLDEHKEYDKGGATKSLSNDEYLFDALAKMGYITIEEDGPKTIKSYGVPMSYTDSRTVRLTDKVGSVKSVAYSKVYSSGFSCYPPPNFGQCDMPELLESGTDYTITGIVQDETHAKVNILIPWKLTPFGKELRPYATAIAVSEAKLGTNSDYLMYEGMYQWEHFLNSHGDSGGSPATILFQKFDDGWRIVDENGKSEKDFN